MTRYRIALPALVKNNESASPGFTRNFFGLHPAHGSQVHYGSPCHRSHVHQPFAKQKPGWPFGLTDLGLARDRH